MKEADFFERGVDMISIRIDILITQSYYIWRLAAPIIIDISTYLHSYDMPKKISVMLKKSIAAFNYFFHANNDAHAD